MPSFLASAKTALVPQPDGAGICKNIQECCSVYCNDTETYLPPFGTVCFCSKDNPQGEEEGIINRALNWIFYVTLVTAPLAVLLGAFMIMVGGGSFSKRKNEKTGIESIMNPTISGGKKVIWGAVVGLTLALMARVFYTLIRFLTGI